MHTIRNEFQTIAFQFKKLVSTSIILRKKIRMKYNKPRSPDMSVVDIIRTHKYNNDSIRRCLMRLKEYQVYKDVEMYAI